MLFVSNRVGILILGITAFAVTMIAAMVFPYTKREMYESTAVARYKVAGVPVMSICAAVFLVFAIFVDEQCLAVKALGVNGSNGLIYLGGCYAITALIYVATKLYRKHRQDSIEPRLPGASRRMIRLFFCTDLHGSDVCFRKFLHAGAAYQADVVIMAADAREDVVPVVAEGDWGWSGEWLGQRWNVDLNPEELATRQDKQNSKDVVSPVCMEDDVFKCLMDCTGCVALFDFRGGDV